jgi:REP element-mobilizing transposase RayT
MAKAGRARKVHQQTLLFRHGGKRRGAGRKPAGSRAGTSHAARPVIDGANAMHVTLRVVSEVGRMRRPAVYRAIRAASVVASRRAQFRIVHLSIQHDHLHLIVEAEDKKALARGMQGFQISAAKHINKAIGVGGPRRGRVFADRYHLVVIRSPTQMRRVLAYVLCNWRKHRDDREAPGWLVDPYATGYAFRGWRELGAAMWPDGSYAWIVVREARSWLLQEGWRRGGEAISAFEVPGGHGE